VITGATGELVTAGPPEWPPRTGGVRISMMSMHGGSIDNDVPSRNGKRAAIRGWAQSRNRSGNVGKPEAVLV
jgi:hypothetical protein